MMHVQSQTIGPNPFRPFENDKPKESVCMTLQEYQMLLPYEERPHGSHPDLGILCTSLTHSHNISIQQHYNFAED